MASFDSRYYSQSAERRFFRESINAPMLTREHEYELATRWREQEDVSALHEIITAYTRLVISTATRFRNYGLPIADLIQEGSVGLLQAAARFEPERAVRFSTYASWWIRSAMQDFVLRNWSIVRTGTTASQKSLFFNLRRLRAKIGAADGPLGREGRQRIAAELKVRLRDVEMMEGRLAASDQSLNAPVGENGEHEWQDFIADTRPLPEEIVVKSEDSQSRAVGARAHHYRQTAPHRRRHDSGRARPGFRYQQGARAPDRAQGVGKAALPDGEPSRTSRRFNARIEIGTY